MMLVAPTLLQFVGMTGLVILLAGALHTRQWMGVLAAVASMLSVVSADVLILPEHWSWVPTIAFVVFALTGGYYLLGQFQQRQQLTMNH